MEQQLRQCPQTGVYYYVPIPDEAEEEVVIPEVPEVKIDRPKMGRPKKR
jgi:hypothetical protein